MDSEQHSRNRCLARLLFLRGELHVGLQVGVLPARGLANLRRELLLEVVALRPEALRLRSAGPQLQSTAEL